MARELKYGQVTMEKGGHIPEDEPVFVLRAKDVLAVPAIEHYLELCEAAGSPTMHVVGVASAVLAMRRWQDKHDTKVPDSSGTAAYTGE